MENYESVPIGLRGFVTLIYGVMWVIGYCSVAPLAYFTTNWRWLIVAYSVPSVILAAIYFFTIPESLHFLMVNNRKQKAAKWIRNAEKYGKVLHKRNLDIMVELLENTCLDVTVHQNKTKTEDLRTSDTFVYYGLSNYSIHLPGNKYWNYILSGLVELPAYISTPSALENFGRKRFVIYMHFLVGISHLALLFIPTNCAWLTISCWLLSKYGISSSFMSIYVYGSEIFPTTMRNICLGLCAVIARFGGVIAPYAILLASVNSLLPIILFGSTALTAGILTSILPETKDRVLPSSLDETTKVDQYSSKISKTLEQTNMPTTSTIN
uniref:Major facilitator superfamily (MFS) profile domain-containing protein n=1 Tax=Setaria digitata TaxID=48799 RepID=A0A915PZ18_9BILA